MAGYVGRLEPNQTLSAEGHFAGPWRDFRRITIEAGTAQDFNASDVEYSIFVMSGTGTATAGSQHHSINPGAALTVGYRAAVTIAADPGNDVELFVTTLTVAP